MNLQVPNPAAKLTSTTRLAIADCDIHHSPRDFKLLYPYLEKRWCDHIDMFGSPSRQGMAKGAQYPKGQPDASRRDAWPPGGGRPGSNLDFMRSHHLDANGIQFGVLTMIRPHPGGMPNLDLSAALCRAINDWQVAEWTALEPRLKASIVVPYEDAEASVAEIERWTGSPHMVQVLLLSRTLEPLGNRRYWPIYEAAAAAGLPVGIHAFGNGGNPTSSTGWASYYIEDMVGHSQSCQALISSMVLEGVFELIPQLRVVLIEAGFAWMPSLSWRLDKIHSSIGSEISHLKRRPSEYLRDHVWMTTQPMEEPNPSAHLRDTIDWIGLDRLLFATDYPHWDYDDPQNAMPLKLSNEEKAAFLFGNAHRLYAPKM